MNPRTWLITCLAVLLAPLSAQAAAVNVVQGLEVTGDEKGAQVVIAGNHAPTFTVFRLADPARVVVDLAGADVSAVRGPRDGKGPVVGVAVSQFSDDKTAVGRVVVAIADEARYDVRAVGDSVVVAVTGGAHADLVAVKGEAPKAEPAPAPVAQAEPAPKAAEPAKAELPPSPAAAAEANVVVSHRDEKTVAQPAHRLNGLKTSKKNAQYLVNFAADGEMGTFDVIELSDPPRLAIDLLGFEKGLKAQKGEQGSPIKEIRYGKHADKVRVVLEVKDGESMPAYQVTRAKSGLVVAMGTVALAPAPVAAAQPKKMEVAKAETKSAGKAISVKDVAFRGDEGSGKVVIGVPQGTEYHVARPDPHTAVLTLSGAVLPKRLERSLDTSAFGGPVKMVSSFTAPGQVQTVQVVATLDGAIEDRVVFEDGQLAWAFGAAGAAASTELVIDGQKVEVEQEASASRASGFAAEAPGYAQSGAARKAKYTGRRVSFEFKEIDIHNLLRIIAEVSKRNVVVADNVGGRVTIRLRNVPWDQALDIILKSKGLDKEETGNIIRVAPLRELEEERKVRDAMIANARKLEPLKVRLIPVNYATASEVSTKVKDLLSERGSMSVDTRTNVIIVKDVLDALARAEGLVRKLDTQTPQVLIEARIVEMNSNLSREVGVQWGGSISFGPQTGNATGLAFPSAIRVGGSSSDDSGGASGTPFAVNLPAATGMGSGGGISFLFGSAGGAAMLNLRLSAFESSGQLKTISAPRITTLDNNPAKIGQGYAIPFSQASASGVNTTFIEAKLELSVTPHVTADGSVLMNINATNNQPDPGLTGANGQPAISKKEAQTQVLVKDGDTTVIGGIYTRQQSMQEAAVPVLSKIPVLGWLFKKRSSGDSRTELLVFITPRIVNRNQVVAASEGGIQ